jgi:hypothetical protein
MVNTDQKFKYSTASKGDGMMNPPTPSDGSTMQTNGGGTSIIIGQMEDTNNSGSNK